MSQTPAIDTNNHNNNDSEQRVTLTGGYELGGIESVMGNQSITDYLEAPYNEAHGYFEVPINRGGLARIRNASVYHPTAQQFKVDQLLNSIVINNTKVLSYETLERFLIDYFTFGDAYLVAEQVTRSGRLVKVGHPLSAYTRRLKKPNHFGMVNGYKGRGIFGLSDEELTIKFDQGSVLQLKQYGLTQTIYGVPSWIPAANAMLLKEAAILFRRKYYKNNAHMGYILYTTLARASDKSVQAIEDALDDAKGVNNFKNLLIHEPNGKPDDIKLIPVSEFAAKDEFFNINEITRDEQIAIERVPPQLLGIIPRNTGGFGNAEDAWKVFWQTGVLPYHRKLEEINRFAQGNLLTFKRDLPKFDSVA